MTLEAFCKLVHPAPGHLIPVSVVRGLFLATLSTKEKYAWHKVNFSQALWQLGHQTGYGTNNRTFVLNVSFDPKAPHSTPWILHGQRRLRRQL